MTMYAMAQRLIAFHVMITFLSPHLSTVFSFTTPRHDNRKSRAASVAGGGVTSGNGECTLFVGRREDNIPVTHPSDRGRRRAVLRVAAAMISSAPVLSAAAAGMEKVSKLTEEEAEKRLREGRRSIQYLFDHFDEIAAGGGDNVRRYLGTVGFTSGLVQIDRTMKALEDRADDFVEFTETRNEVVQSIQQADGSAYMAIFVATSPSETPPDKYFGDSKIEVRNCIKAMDRLAELIDLKY